MVHVLCINIHKGNLTSQLHNRCIETKEVMMMIMMISHPRVHTQSDSLINGFDYFCNSDRLCVTFTNVCVCVCRKTQSAKTARCSIFPSSRRSFSTTAKVRSSGEDKVCFYRSVSQSFPVSRKLQHPIIVTSTLNSQINV